MSYIVIQHHSCDYDMCGKYRCSDSYDVTVHGPFDTLEEAENTKELLNEDDGHSGYWFYAIKSLNKD